MDLYTAEVGTYLPTAEFQPEGDNYYNTTYTMLYLDGAAEGKRFASGVIDVVAEPNEETREILYALEGHLYSSEGDYEVVFRYKGLIEGYHLPPAGLDIPEGAIYFETDADTNQPVRLKASGEPTSEIIKTEGQKLSGSEATIGGLQPETGYVVFALAVNGDRKAVTAQEFVTAESEFDGYEFNKLAQAVYRTDNDAVAGNYEVTFGNCTAPEWVGDIQVFLDLYNVEDSDPLNPVLPNGVYEAGSEYAPFTYNPSYSYVDIVVEDMGDGNYKFTFDLVDDGGNKITGDWTGVVNVDDLSDEIAGGDTASVQRLSVVAR